MNRTLAAEIERSKHQFDVVEKVDSEHLFGHDGGMIEQVFPTPGEAMRGEAGRMRLTSRGRAVARTLAIVLVVAMFLGGSNMTLPKKIARRVAPGLDPRPVVDRLIEANDLRGGLQAGEELSIPVPER